MTQNEISNDMNPVIIERAYSMACSGLSAIAPPEGLSGRIENAEDTPLHLNTSFAAAAVASSNIHTFG
jgi:hypothetical protein